VTEIKPPVLILPPVMLPVAVINPPVLTFPPAILAVTAKLPSVPTVVKLEVVTFALNKLPVNKAALALTLMPVS
jgi:hypothetical protein